MPPLVDTDIFCKLGVVGLLEQSLALFGVGLAECSRLPALPHMLRRGQIPKLYGQSACDALIPIAEAMPAAPTPSTAWLDRLVGVPRIDPGEAQLFACAAEKSQIMLTGDKKAWDIQTVITAQGVGTPEKKDDRNPWAGTWALTGTSWSRLLGLPLRLRRDAELCTNRWAKTKRHAVGPRSSTGKPLAWSNVKLTGRPFTRIVRPSYSLGDFFTGLIDDLIDTWDPVDQHRGRG